MSITTVEVSGTPPVRQYEVIHQGRSIAAVNSLEAISAAVRLHCGSNEPRADYFVRFIHLAGKST